MVGEMKRSNLNFLVDAAAFALFVFLVATGIIMEFLLPAGSGHSTTLWGLDRHQWGNIHFWISVGFLTSLALHVYLHWKWIVSVLRGRPRDGTGARVGLGILGLVALLAIAAAPLISPVDSGSSARGTIEPRWDLSTDAELIQGSMTLGDVIEATGVHLQFLVREMGLPSDVSTDDRLGRVARDNGLSVEEIRAIVELGIAGHDSDRATEVEPEDRMPTVVDSETRSDVRTLTLTEPENPAPTAAAEPAQEESHTDHAESQAGLADIRGSMTLAEIVALGVPRILLYSELGIPTRIPITERIGRLGRTYSFSMIQVRDLVEAHR